MVANWSELLFGKPLELAPQAVGAVGAQSLLGFPHLADEAKRKFESFVTSARKIRKSHHTSGILHPWQAASEVSVEPEPKNPSKEQPDAILNLISHIETHQNDTDAKRRYARYLVESLNFSKKNAASSMGITLDEFENYLGSMSQGSE